MRILLIAQYFPPDITAAAFRMFDTARLLKAAGHDVAVITARPHRSQADGESDADYDAQIGQVWRTPVVPLNGGRFVGYIRHYASFMTGATWLGLCRLNRRWKPDVIWASSPPLFVGISGVALSRWFRVPLVLDVRDIWPASAVGTGQLSPDGKAYRFGEKMERFVYNRASHITCVAQPMREYIRTKTTTDVTVVYNGTKAADIVADVPAAADSEDDRTLLYAGNLGRAQQLDLLIRAWARIRQRNGNHRWTMKFLGSGAVEGDLKKLAAELGVDNSIAFAPAMSRQGALREMARASALSVSLQANKAFERTIPSKIFDCMAVGRPILGGVAGEGRGLLESTGANLCYEPGNQDDLERVLGNLLHDYDRLNQLAGRNPAIVRRAYTRERAVDVLMGVFERVAQPKAVAQDSRPFVERRRSTDTIMSHQPRSPGTEVREVPRDRDTSQVYSGASPRDV